MSTASLGCGYCVLRTDGRASRAVAMGVLRTVPADPTPVRLAGCMADLDGLLGDSGPLRWP
ncbi:MAG: hypothetical protein R2716_11290 [Microthrixaceae bacterium]